MYCKLITLFFALVLTSFNVFAYPGFSVFLPQDTNAFAGPSPYFLLPNDNGGLKMFGAIDKKQIGTEFVKSGVFSLDLTEDDVFVYKYKHNSFKANFSDTLRPIPLTDNTSLVYRKGDGGYKLITSWYKYYTDGGMGYAAMVYPHYFDYDSEGNLTNSYVDTVNDPQNVSFLAPLSPLVLNNDKSIYMVHTSPNGGYEKIYFSKYSATGDLIERIPIVINEPINPNSGIKYVAYDPVKVIRNSSDEYFLYCTKKRYFNNNSADKSSSIIKVSKDFKYLWSVNKQYDLDSSSKYRVNTFVSDMILNKQEDIVFTTRHAFATNYEVKNGEKNFFITKVSPDGLIKDEIACVDTVHYGSTLLQASSGEYYYLGTRTLNKYTDNVHFNYSIYKYSEDLKLNGVCYNTSTEIIDDCISIIQETNPNIFDCFGSIGNRILHFRLNPSDFIQVGIIEDNLYDIKLYPNPSNGVVYINSTEMINKIEISDYSGRMVQTYEELNENGFSFNLSGYSTGVYFVKIFAGNRITVKQVVLID